MAIGFGKNLLAATTVRYMDRSNRALGMVNTQLSSGLRINKASDDPASLAVSMNLNTNSRISGRAELNITDGISLLQVADGALQSTRDVVGRMAELATQASNGSFSDTQRSALNKELTELKSELIRIRESVSFNGTTLLAGGPVSGVTGNLVAGQTWDAQASADGRYVTYRNLVTSALYQIDTTTGVETTIASSGGTIAATSGGDYVAYRGTGNNIYLWDRFTGTSRSLGVVSSMDLLAISNDGSTVAFVGRNAWSASGSDLGNLGNRYLTIIDTATGQFKGDDGNSSLTAYSSLTISPDGSTIALVGTGGVGMVWNASDLTATAFETTGFVATKVRLASDNSLLFASVSNVNGQHASGASDVWKYDGTTYSAVTSINSGTGVNDFFLTDNGSSITFTASANLVGQNAAGVRQLYKQDLVGSLKQLTAFTSTEATNLTNVSGDGYTMYTRTVPLLQARDIRGEAAVVLDTGDGVQWGITGRIRALDAAVRGLYYFDVSTQRKAKISLELANDNVDRLGAATGEIGAGLSRLESAYRATRSKTTEFRSATDRISSADIAESSAEAIRQSAIQNVQASLLAQSSNLIPEIALRLLQSATSQGN